MPPPASSQQFPPTTNPNVIYSGPYSDPGYLQMALGAYLTPSSSVYKSVDPYFLSQGSNKSYKKSVDIFFPTWSMKSLSFLNPCFFVKLVEKFNRNLDLYFNSTAGLFSGANFFPGGGCSADIALGLGMNVNALRHCRRRKARTVFSDPQLTGLEKRFENQR